MKKSLIALTLTLLATGAAAHADGTSLDDVLRSCWKQGGNDPFKAVFVIKADLNALAYSDLLDLVQDVNQNANLSGKTFPYIYESTFSFDVTGPTSYSSSSTESPAELRKRLRGNMDAELRKLAARPGIKEISC